MMIESLSFDRYNPRSMVVHARGEKTRTLPRISSYPCGSTPGGRHQVNSGTKDLEAEVAERKLKEEALRESEERYRSLFDKASDGILILSSDGKLIDANESFARMHGYGTGELLRMNIRDLDTTKTAEL